MRLNKDVKPMIPRFIPQDFYMKIYLVNLDEKKFLMVKRYIDHDFDKCTWIEKKSLGDFALLLGDNTSIAVLTSNISGCQQDCIYFNYDFERMIDLMILVCMTSKLAHLIIGLIASLL